MIPHIKKFPFLFLLILSISSGCGEKPSRNTNLRNVILTTPLPSDKEAREEFAGIIEEDKNINVSFMADGKISSLHAKEGDRVKAGQLLATLDDSDYIIGVSQLKAQYNQMTEEKKRMDEMFSRHNISPNDYEKFSAGYEQLKLQMELAEKKLGYTKLYSPSAGYISEKFMEPGELVGAGTPIFKITDDSNLVVVVDLPVSMFVERDKITKIQGFTPSLPDEAIPLKILSFTPDASNSMLYKMKLSIPAGFHSSLIQGMNMKVAIVVNENNEESHRLPVRSILNDNGICYIWVFNPSDSTISRKQIQIIGEEKDNLIKVKGLDGSEKVVETGIKQLFDGEKVVETVNLLKAAN